LVCDECLDKPNPQLKARLMPPDPVPIANPRPELYLYRENVKLLGVSQTIGPASGAAVGTERNAASNWSAGTPMEIEG
jgi:hypothetical protein